MADVSLLEASEISKLKALEKFHKANIFWKPGNAAILAQSVLAEINTGGSDLVPDLKKELKNRGLSTTGNKNELVERLQRALKSNDTIDDIEEDLLNDEDDDVSESGILELDDSPKTQKRKLPTTTTENKDASEPPKKVILNRATSLSIPRPKAEPIKKPVEVPKKDVEVPKENKNISDNEEDKKVVKLTELTAKDRLELRAKKFGAAALTDDIKKLARAERFGTNSSNGSKKSEPISKLMEATSIDVLKKRAERFGVSVSSAMTSVENKEKLEKRKERFGAVTINSKNGISTDDAKKARAERFKTVK